ncbi:hypothetical protein E5676_scaffold313G002220 [Cucumis melo var. makuwa]|uniref:Uncharacterized protein n=1 Tax=Cucumis melo var. makuwa TaxID=1194695 RepID=A0A5A7V7J2_CUCMM|nr:hypothetical protein E6C27_scaffold154G001620 [Cucumis melo var. makuwa]TYK26592.1 hypothetical protein E5676_scaffold313G002220 [Cucumis melo var. makuwa]
MGLQIARVRERASSWVLFYKTLMGSKGKGRGKLASDREGFIACHMGTQLCFRVYGTPHTTKVYKLYDVVGSTQHFHCLCHSRAHPALATATLLRNTLNVNNRI